MTHEAMTVHMTDDEVQLVRRALRAFADKNWELAGTAPRTIRENDRVAEGNLAWELNHRLRPIQGETLITGAGL